MPPNVTLYIGGDTGFDQNWVDASPSGRPAIQQQIESTVTALSKMAWNVYILSFLHVHARSGPTQLFFNGTPVEKLYPGLGQQLARLKANGSRLLISIGGWDNACDFSGIQKVGIDSFLALAQQQVITPLGLHGIDLDLEPTEDDDPKLYCPYEPGWDDVYRRYSQVLVDLSNQAAAGGLLVTHAPATYMSPGIYTNPGGILERTRRQPQGNAIAWLNYQTYSEGQGVANTYAAFVGMINPSLTGIANPALFVSPGFGIADGLNDDPNVARDNILKLRGKYVQINGAFVWRYTPDQAKIANWATVLHGALG